MGELSSHTGYNGQASALDEFVARIREFETEGQATNTQEIPDAIIHESAITTTRAYDKLGCIGIVALRAARLDRAKNDLDEAVLEARAHGAAWADIGKAVGTTLESARAKWDPEARRKKTDAERERRRRLLESHNIE